MANETQFLIKGNFFIAKNVTTRKEFFRVAVNNVKFTRTSTDEFIFFNNNNVTLNSYGGSNLNTLGALDQTTVDYKGGEQRTSFSYSDSLDSDGLPFIDADAMDDWLSSNLGFFFNKNGTTINGTINTTPDPLLLTETQRLRVSELYSQLDLKQINDSQPLFYDVVNFGTATNVHSVDEAWSTISTVNSGDYAIVQTKQRGNYQSGKPIEVLQTFANFDTVAGQEIRIGYNTATTTAPHINNRDGYFISSIDGVVALEVWKTGTQISYAEQSNWTDPLDGNGESGVTVDWSKIQIMRSTFLWLGVDGITFYFKIDGKLIMVNKFTYENNSPTVFMSSPNQPIRFEVRQTGATPITFNYICSSIGSDGSINVTGKNGGVDDDGLKLDANSTNEWYYAIGLRLQASKVDSFINILNAELLSNTNDSFLFRIVLNPTYNGSVTYTDVANYSVSYGLGTTSNTITSNGTILNTGNGSSNSSKNISLENSLRIGSKIDGTLDEVVVIVKPLSSNLDIFRSLNFREQI